MSKKVSGWPLIAPTEVDTSITGDQVMEALASDVEAGDNGKVLTAIYGGIEGEETGSVVWAKADPLPVIGEGDAGKVLTVNAGETGTEWAAAGVGVEMVKMPYGISAQQSASHSAESTTSAATNTIDLKYAGKKIVAMFVMPNWGTGPCPDVWISWPSNNSNYWPRTEEVGSDGKISVLVRHQESSGAAYNWNFYYFAVIAM